MLGTRRLVVRVAVALAAATAGIWALQALVMAEDRRVRDVEAVLPSVPAVSPLAGLGVRLRPVAGAVYVATRLDAIAPDVAPVVQILADGSLALRRPAPLARGPLTMAGGRDGAVGVVLPAASLAGLDGAQRGALLDLLSIWIDERPLRATRLQFVTVAVAADELDRMLSWAP